LFPFLLRNTSNRQQRETRISYSSGLGKTYSSTQLERTVDKHMQEYTSLKEIGQVYSNENPKRILTNNG
jgi:hypothetical protein